MVKNAYIHIPFCQGKCRYCTFVSFDKIEQKEAYIKALAKQIKMEYQRERLKTLYFGGGTPSLLEISQISTVLSQFNLENGAEITIEVNPDSVDFNYLKQFRALGVNRLSIGSQTFNDEILKQIGRKHSSEQIKNAVKWAKKADFDNISLDFIYGLPNQDVNDFISDLKDAVALDVQHISLYGLKVEEGCYFYTNEPQNIADLDTQADMYLRAVEYLTQNGFEHYEISNFSKKNFESRHNMNYWSNNTYYGFGCAASGYVNDIRYTNESKLDKYIKNSLMKEIEQKLTGQEMLEEAIFLGFRKTAGINLNEINKKFNIDFNKDYSKILEKYSDFFIKTQYGWALSLNGILVSNEILSEFIKD